MFFQNFPLTLYVILFFSKTFPELFLFQTLQKNNKMQKNYFSNILSILDIAMGRDGGGMFFKNWYEYLSKAVRTTQIVPCEFLRLYDLHDCMRKFGSNCNGDWDFELSFILRLGMIVLERSFHFYFPRFSNKQYILSKNFVSLHPLM